MAGLKSITGFFYTLFGQGEDEKRLRKEMEAFLERKQKNVSNYAIAKQTLEQAQQDMHEKADQIRDRMSSIPARNQ